jgi:hypothetical protein
LNCPDAAQGAGADFDALENLRRLAFAAQVDAPTQLAMWQDDADTPPRLIDSTKGAMPMPRDTLVDAELLAFEAGYSTVREDEALATPRRFPQGVPALALEGFEARRLCDRERGQHRFVPALRPRQKLGRSSKVRLPSSSASISVEQNPTQPRNTDSRANTDQSEGEAFKNVKAALVKLVRDGDVLDFPAVDANPLSQLFKAKILSLYFPEKYLNVCSGEHIEILALKLGNPQCECISQYQHLLAMQKSKHRITRGWSNPKYMEYPLPKVPSQRTKRRLPA